MAADKFILIAIIGKAQGLRGQVRLKFFGESAQSLQHYKHFYDKNGAVYTVKSLHFQKNLPIVGFQEIANRDAAEKLAGTDLFVRRSQLPKLSEEDVFYQEDLLGFTALSANGEIIGTVSGFFNFGGGDLLELTLSPCASTADTKSTQGKNRAANNKPKKELIPFSKAVVSQIDMEASRLVVDQLAAGLLSAQSDEMAEAEAEITAKGK